MRSRRIVAAVAVTAAAVGTTLVAGPVTASAGSSGSSANASISSERGAAKTYLVLAEKGASRSDTVKAIKAAGGTVTSVNTHIGLYEVRSDRVAFGQAVRAEKGIRAAGSDRVIGKVPGAGKVKRDTVEKEAATTSARGTAAALPTPGPTYGMDPLDEKLWGLRMVRSDKARAVNAGDKRVRVGVLDSGIDFSHPDLAGQVDEGLSRNFTRDIPDIDGPCEYPELDCVDPVGVDNDGHGTHVAGTIAAAANGFGVSGVAPNVTLVEIRGGQDSGFLFLKPVSDALTYAGEVGLDVVNMSFYVDPWLYNCVNGAPEDSAEEVASQQLVIATMNAAMDYAHAQGVTMVGSLGNNHEDLSNLRVDTSSPDYPEGIAHTRTVTDAQCVDLPVEGRHVIGVSALGPSEAKADYSNYSTGGAAKGEIEVSAPGGWFRDYFGTAQFRVNENEILSTYPLNALQAQGQVDKNGRVTKAGQDLGTIKVCASKKTPFTECGYYAYLQGTSMASPHATGVAALAVSAWGSGTTADDFGLAPDTTRSILLNSAREHACPSPATVDYLDEGRSAEFTATCVGDLEFNGFYGYGIVDAYAAVTTGAAS